MTRIVDIERVTRLWLALLLLVTSLGIVCVLMSPSAAAAGDAPAGDCRTPGDTEMVSCPHLAADRDVQTGKSPTYNDDILPAVAQAQATSAIAAYVAHANADVPDRPVSHPAPIRI